MRSESVLIDTDYDAIVHRRRSRFVFEVSIFSLIILLIYFVVDLYVSTNADLIVIALFGMIFFVILYLLDAKKAKQASIILAVIGLIGLFFGASNDEVGDYGLFFFSEFPILAFFLFGKREGFRWTFVLVGLMVVAFILGQQHLLFTSFSLRSWI